MQAIASVLSSSLYEHIHPPRCRSMLHLELLMKMLLTKISYTNEPPIAILAGLASTSFFYVKLCLILFIHRRELVRYTVLVRTREFLLLSESTGKLHRMEIWKQDKVAVASGFITTWEGSLSDVIGVPDALPCSCLPCLDDVVALEEEKKKKWV